MSATGPSRRQPLLARHGRVHPFSARPGSLRQTSENLSRLFSALREFWAGDVPGLRGPEELGAEGTVVQFGQPPNRLDLISSIEGVEFDEAWQGRLEATLVSPDGEVPLFYIGLDELIRNKRATGRPKDLDDLGYEGHTERLEAAHDSRYRIERKLGEGGMASVYLAEDIKHQRRVALKILRPEIAAVIGADRFLSEIDDESTASLD